MTPDLSSVIDPRPDSTPVRLADHSVVEATHRGKAKLPIEGNASIKTLVVPSLHEPLLSVANLCDEGLTVVFTKTSCDILKTSSTKINGDLAGRGYRRGNLYYLPSEPVSSCSSLSLSPQLPDHSLFGYHCRFSHISLKPLKLILKTNNIIPSVMNKIDVQRCQVCVQAKMPRKAFKSRSAHCSTSPGQLIHSDVASYETVSREGYKYFITFGGLINARQPPWRTPGADWRAGLHANTDWLAGLQANLLQGRWPARQQSLNTYVYICV
jgi:hypothetical protein